MLSPSPRYIEPNVLRQLCAYSRNYIRSETMRIVLANHGFAHAGGTEVYLLTVADHFQRLGHEVSVYAHELGPFSDHAREHGVKAYGELHDLPAECDALLTQDAVVAYELADRYPDARHVFRVCSDVYDLSMPPQLDGVVDKILVLSDRYARLASACAVTAPLLRLHVPIDIDRLTPLGSIRARPRRAVLLGNYSDRHELVREVWGRQGVEVAVVGGDQQRYDVAAAVADADIVIAKARAALDGMACGRAVYIFDAFGGDGWVTPARHAALEADNFAGLATGRVIDAAALERDLAEYDPRMGIANRDLVVQHHSARDHVIELVEAISELRPGSRPDAPRRELARLTDLLWSSDRLVRGPQSVQLILHERLARAEARAPEAADALACARQETEQLEAQVRELHAEIDTVRATRAWRLATYYWRVRQRFR